MCEMSDEIFREVFSASSNSLFNSEENLIIHIQTEKFELF